MENKKVLIDYVGLESDFANTFAGQPTSNFVDAINYLIKRINLGSSYDCNQTKEIEKIITSTKILIEEYFSLTLEKGFVVYADKQKFLKSLPYNAVFQDTSVIKPQFPKIIKNIDTAKDIEQYLGYKNAEIRLTAFRKVLKFLDSRQDLMKKEEIKSLHNELANYCFNIYAQKTWQNGDVVLLDKNNLNRTLRQMESWRQLSEKEKTQKAKELKIKRNLYIEKRKYLEEELCPEK